MGLIAYVFLTQNLRRSYCNYNSCLNVQTICEETTHKSPHSAIQSLEYRSVYVITLLGISQLLGSQKSLDIPAVMDQESHCHYFFKLGEGFRLAMDVEIISLVDTQSPQRMYRISRIWVEGRQETETVNVLY